MRAASSASAGTVAVFASRFGSLTAPSIPMGLLNEV
jgi:hypothetical protein